MGSILLDQSCRPLKFIQINPYYAVNLYLQKEKKIKNQLKNTRTSRTLNGVSYYSSSVPYLKRMHLRAHQKTVQEIFPCMYTPCVCVVRRIMRPSGVVPTKVDIGAHVKPVAMLPGVLEIISILTCFDSPTSLSRSPCILRRPIY